MLTRVSNITSYEHVPSSGGRAATSVTTIVHHWHDEYYSSRAFGHLTPLQVEVEEERFLERRHRRTA